MTLITATPAALDYLRPAEPELTKEIRGGRAVAELATELEGEKTAGDLTADQIEAGLWTLVRDELDRAAEEYGQQAAGQAVDSDPAEWPEGSIVNTESVLQAIGQREAPHYVNRQIGKTFRAAYAAARRD